MPAASPLVTKLQLGHALVLEALLPAGLHREGARTVSSTPTKRSFADKCVPKLEFGNERQFKPLGQKLGNAVAGEAALSL